MICDRLGMSADSAYDVIESRLTLGASFSATTRSPGRRETTHPTRSSFGVECRRQSHQNKISDQRRVLHAVASVLGPLMQRGGRVWMLGLGDCLCVSPIICTATRLHRTTFLSLSPLALQQQHCILQRCKSSSTADTPREPRFWLDSRLDFAG